MSKNIRFGANLMRLLQALALAAAVAGFALSMTTRSGTAPADTGLAGLISSLLFLLIALLLGASLWILASRNLARKIQGLSATLQQVTDGDLTARVEVTVLDEMGHLGQNLNRMLDNFEHLIIGIDAISASLTTISRENDEAARKVLHAVQVQSQEVESASAAVAGIIRTVDRVTNGVVNLSGSAEINASSLREMTASIAEVREDVATQGASIDEVTSSIIEMTAVMEEISANVRSLLDASQNTISSVAQMDVSIKQVEQNAGETAAISAAVLRDAETGKEAVDATIDGIDQIRISSRNTFDSIDTLSNRVSAIGSILSVIDEIAEQTNLLALNSAIIAAQAGEHGKGFAIVAAEIKGLANRTRRSTMEIADLIAAVREETAKAVAAIRLTEQKVVEGETLSRRSGEALGKIVSGVEMAAQRGNDIARATVEQARGSQSIHGAMRHVGDMVAQIARSCQESTRTNSSIMMAVERMKSFTSQVTASAANQQQIGTDIARSTERMTADIAIIRDSCGEQSDRSSQIVQSVDLVRDATQSTQEAARSLDQGVVSLVGQIELLRAEMMKMHVSRKENSP
jgi:methyl-accepting chemotaxis protein